MRQSAVSFHLRAEQLCLDRAQCFFWAHAASTRWHCSWSADPDHPAALEQVLHRAESYGLSFVGFSSEVTGRLLMSRFSIASP